MNRRHLHHLSATSIAPLYARDDKGGAEPPASEMLSLLETKRLKARSFHPYITFVSRYARATSFALNPYEADMTYYLSCPRCHSTFIATCDYARTTGAAGAAADTVVAPPAALVVPKLALPSAWWLALSA